MDERLQRRKLESIFRTGATRFATTNPDCLLQMRAALDQAEANHLETLHLTEVLERSLPAVP